MENTYYERTNGRTWELCQNRFKNNPDHPHNVCAVATSHEQLKEMYESCLSGGADWLEEEIEYGHIPSDSDMFCQHGGNADDCIVCNPKTGWDW